MVLRKWPSCRALRKSNLYWPTGSESSAIVFHHPAMLKCEAWYSPNSLRAQNFVSRIPGSKWGLPSMGHRGELREDREL